MRISRKSRKLVDQVFMDGQGWIRLKKAIPVRRLWWKANPYRGASAVHFVEHGDYMVKELRDNTKKVAR